MDRSTAPQLVLPPIADPFEERKDIKNSSSNIRRARGQRGRVGVVVSGDPVSVLSEQDRRSGSTGSSGSAAPEDTNLSASRDVPHTPAALSPPHPPRQDSSAFNLKRLQTGSVHDTKGRQVYLANGASRERGKGEREVRLTRRAAVGRAMCRVLRLPAAAQADSPPAGRRFPPPTPVRRRIQRSWSTPQHRSGDSRRDEHQPEDTKLVLTAGEPPAAAAASSAPSSSAVPRQFVQAWHAQEAQRKKLQEQVERLETRLQLEQGRQEGAAHMRARQQQQQQQQQLDRMSVPELDELVARASAQREVQLARAAARLQNSWRERARRGMQRWVLDGGPRLEVVQSLWCRLAHRLSDACFSQLAQGLRRHQQAALLHEMRRRSGQHSGPHQYSGAEQRQWQPDEVDALTHGSQGQPFSSGSSSLGQLMSSGPDMGLPSSSPLPVPHRALPPPPATAAASAPHLSPHTPPRLTEHALSPRRSLVAQAQAHAAAHAAHAAHAAAASTPLAGAWARPSSAARSERRSMSVPVGGQLRHTGAAFLEAATYHCGGAPLSAWEAERQHTPPTSGYYDGSGDEGGEAHRRVRERSEWSSLREGTASLSRSYSGAADEEGSLGGATADEWHARSRAAWHRAHHALREAELEPAERELLVFVCNPMHNRRMALPHLEREASDISTVIPAAIYQGGSPNLLREQLSLKTTRRFLFRRAHHMRTARTPHMRAACAPHAHHMHTACTLHAHCMHAAHVLARDDAPPPHAAVTPMPGWARKRHSASPPRTRARSRPCGRTSSPRC